MSGAAVLLFASVVLLGTPEQQLQSVPPTEPVRVLFLGMDQERPHNPARMFAYLAPTLARRGVHLTYVSDQALALTPDKLKHYDALMVYGNQRTLPADQEAALVSFVEGGKGLVAIHSASAMFRSSEAYVTLIGGAFQSHGTGDFTAEIVQPNHPAMATVVPFETWDETYVHNRHNLTDRTVLMERVDAAGREPWTWVRTQGTGRVFYTAYGHDERTWGKAEFARLIENGVRWAAQRSDTPAQQSSIMPEVKYIDGWDVPNYEQRTPAPRFQLPLSAAETHPFLVAPAEFDVTLFAAEPDIVKPIYMAFDERGRLFVAEARDYPNMVLNGHPGADQIKILEDTNGDGRADKVTIFADGLNLLTSFTFANDGVIATAAPHTFFLKDSNGDDKADVRQILFTGWSTRDTHFGPSNIQYGPDNYIWGMIGSSGFDGVIGGKVVQFANPGVAYRFKPDGTDFEIMTNVTNNAWGLGFNEIGDLFGSTANGDPSWHMGIPNRYFEGVDGLPPLTGRTRAPGYQSLAQFTSIHPMVPYLRQVDNQGFYTAAAGHTFYTARAFPKEYWNRMAFISEATGKLVGQVVIEPHGSGYVAKDGRNLIASAEEWFSPAATVVGPDGAVWVDDWSNFITQHNPTPAGYMVGRGNAFESSMRDRSRGRIYRVSYKGAAVQKKRLLSKTDTAGLIEALASDNMFWRLTAQRLIVERGQKDVVPQLLTLVRSTSVDAVGLNGGAFHALWALHGLGELSSTTTDAYRTAVAALRHPAASVRKAAAMVLPRAAEAANALHDAGLLSDPNLNTRLAATLVMIDMQAAPAIGQALYGASKSPENFGDPWLGRAIYLAATRHRDAFLAAYRADTDRLPFSSLSVPLRLGTLTPDWRTPPANEVSSDWEDMTLPGAWETNGLANFDGVVWFTRTIDLAPGGPMPDRLSLGPIRNTARLWVNGNSLGTATAVNAAGGGGQNAPPVPAPAAPAGGAGQTGGDPRAPAPRPTAAATVNVVSVDVPAGTFKSGANTITVQVTNTLSDGGFVGAAADMYLEAGGARTPLAGAWKYRVERSQNTGAMYTKPGELAAHAAFTAAGGVKSAAGASLPVVAAVPDVVLQLGVVPSEMKYSTQRLTVQAGQLVELVFTNADSIDHNVVIGAVGSLATIGAAADQFAAVPGAAAQGYVPDMTAILAKTPLVGASQVARIQFRAPAVPGDYPYICTFPGHWRIMNGILTVTAPPPAGRGRGAGPGAGPASPGAPPAPGQGRGN